MDMNTSGDKSAGTTGRVSVVRLAGMGESLESDRVVMVE